MGLSESAVDGQGLVGQQEASINSLKGLVLVSFGGSLLKIQ